MAYRPALTVRVEALGATFYFGAADVAMAQVMETMIAIEGFRIESPPAEAIRPLCLLAVQGIRAWDGVQDEAGNPLECTETNKHELPTMDKVEIASAYLVAMWDLEEKKGIADKLPTSSTPPGMAVEDGGESHTE